MRKIRSIYYCSGTIINSKFRNNVNLKLSKSRTIFSKISQNFFLIFSQKHKIFPKSHANITYNILKIIRQLSEKIYVNFYIINAKFTVNFPKKKKLCIFSLNNLRFLSISFLVDSFYKISSIANILFLKNF